MTAEFDFGAGPVPAHRHANGGGWVADSAKVADCVYVGADARVAGGVILGGLIRGGEIRGGVIYDGEIRGGVIRGGVIRGGVIRGGVIYGGEIRGGEIRDGEIRGGVIRGGVIRGGVIYDGEILGGVILGGVIRGGVIRGGVIYDGEIRGGVIRGGVIRGGVIYDGEIRGGEIRGGEIRGGEIRGGVIYGGVIRGGAIYDTPLYFALSRDPIAEGRDPEGRVVYSIGCETHPMEVWLADATAIGTRHGYSVSEIAEYRRWLTLIAGAPARRDGNGGVINAGRKRSRGDGVLDASPGDLGREGERWRPST